MKYPHQTNQQSRSSPITDLSLTNTMVDWLHCNLCFTQPGDGIKFWLTSCGHVYCEKCHTDGTKDNCKMCKATSTSIQLTGKMQPEVETYFTEPSELIKKHTKQLMQVIDFQTNHRRRYMNYLKNKISKQNEYLQQVKQALMIRPVLQREIAKLKEENNYLKRLISDKGFSSGSRNNTPSRAAFPSYRASPTMTPEMMSPYSKINTPISNTSRGNTPMNFQSQLSDSRSNLLNMSGNFLPQMSGRVSIRTPPCEGRIETPIISETPTPTKFNVSNY